MANLETLLPTNWKSLVSSWLQEDTPSFDYGGYVVGNTPLSANLYIKSPGTIAGLPFFDEVFNQLGCTVIWSVAEGQSLNPVDRLQIATVSGPARERPALNMLARASGIATQARALFDLKILNKWPGIIAATRKTTPGFRVVEKYAALVGGADPHRYDLSSLIMLKDNHIWATGSITSAIKQARSVGGFALKIEVECRSEEEAEEAITAGADIIMLDNFDALAIDGCAQRLKERFVDHRFLIEGSGGLDEGNCVEYMSPWVDILSFGSITQSVKHVDFSLKIAH